MTSSAPAQRSGSRHRRRLALVLGLVTTVMVAEIVGGLWTGSLALLSDGGHMATDALGLGMAMAAIVVADRSFAGDQRTYGLYRVEILAALANAVVLFGVAGYVLYEAVRRLQAPAPMMTGPVLAIATVGLIVNIFGWRMLRSGSRESINIEGAYLEVLADLVGSVGVIAAALVVRYTGWLYADPLVGAAIAVFILPRAWRLGTKAVRILVQAAPDDVDLGALRDDLSAIRGVIDVHDLHVWTLTSDMNVASVHLMTPEGVDPHHVLDEARQLLQESYAIGHATLQVEPETHVGCTEMTW